MGKVSKVTYEFKVGDLIFAKIKGSPYWPARIEATSKELLAKNKFNIRFYGSLDTYLAKKELLLPYNEETKKTHAQHKRIKSFNEGLRQIEHDPDLLQHPDVTSETSEDADTASKATSSGKSSANTSQNNEEGSEASRKSIRKAKQKTQKTPAKTVEKLKLKGSNNKKTIDDKKQSTRRSGRKLGPAEQASPNSPANSETKEESSNDSPKSSKTVEHSEESKSSESSELTPRRQSSRSKQQTDSLEKESPDSVKADNDTNKLAGIFESEATSSSNSLTVSNDAKSAPGNSNESPIKTNFTGIIKNNQSNTVDENDTKKINVEEKSTDIETKEMQVTDNNEVPMATEEPEPISNEENTNKIETQEKNIKSEPIKQEASENSLVNESSSNIKYEQQANDNESSFEKTLENSEIINELSIENKETNETKPCLKNEKDHHMNELQKKKLKWQNMTPEEQAEVKKDLKAKKTLEKKQAYVKSIQIQRALFRMDTEIKMSLKLDHTDVERCHMIMEDMLKLPFEKKHLFNSPEIIDTIKKCRKFTDNKVKRIATDCFEKLRYMFLIPECESFDSIFKKEQEKFLRENVEELKKERAVAAKLDNTLKRKAIQKSQKENEPGKKLKTNRTDSVDGNNDKKPKLDSSKNTMDTS